MLSNSGYLRPERQSARRAHRSVAVDDLLATVASRHQVLDLTLSDVGGLLIGCGLNQRQAESAAAFAPMLLDASPAARGPKVDRMLRRLDIDPQAQVLVRRVALGRAALLLTVTALDTASGVTAADEVQAGLARIFAQLSKAA